MARPDAAAGRSLLPGDGVRIDAEHAGQMASADVQVDRATGKVTITTSNAAAITLGEQVRGDVPFLRSRSTASRHVAKRGTRISVELTDGRRVDASEGPGTPRRRLRVMLAGRRAVQECVHKSLRAGIFHRGNSAEENAWSLARARFDAEQWWYRGNGRAVLISDAVPQEARRG